MDTPTLDEGQHDSTASRPSRARAFLPRGMADRDMSGGRSGPMAAVASGGGSSGVPGEAPAAAAAVTATPPPVSGIRKGDSGAVADLPAMRTGGGSASATGGSTLWPTLSIPDVNAGGGDVGDRGNDGGGGGGVGGGGDGGVGGGGSGVGGGGSGIGGGGSGVGGAGSFLRVGSALRRGDSSMHRSETGRARLMHKLSSPRPPPGPGEWAALELARQQTAERLGADTRLAMDEPEKPGKAVDDEAKEEARAAKEKKELQKKIKDYMKTGTSQGAGDGAQDHLGGRDGGRCVLAVLGWLTDHVWIVVIHTLCHGCRCECVSCNRPALSLASALSSERTFFKVCWVASPWVLVSADQPLRCGSGQRGMRDASDRIQF